MASNQIPANRRHALQRAARRGDVAAQRLAGSEVLEELWKRLLAGTEKDRVRVRGGLVRQRGDMQAAQRNEDTLGPIRIGHRIRALRVGDVDLNDDQVRMVVGVYAADVFVNDDRLIVGTEIRGERGQAKRRKQRVFDRTPIGARGFGERRQDELGT